MTPPALRLATETDADAVLAIYAPIVRETVISFELEPPTLEEMRSRIRETLAQLPWLVCANGGDVLGYVYARPFRSRAAYCWSVEVSAYVRADCRRMGIARALYTALFAILTLQGYYNAYAGIALPNPASVGLHESLGFHFSGVYRQAGYKLGAWHDVGWWQRSLRDDRADPPAPPLPLDAVRASAGWQAALDSGIALLKS